MNVKNEEITLNSNNFESKDKNSNMVRKRIYNYFYKYRVNICFAVFLYVIDAFITVLSPKIAGQGITALSNLNADGLPDIDLNYILRLLSFLLVLYSLSGLCTCLARFLISKTSVELIYEIRRDISVKINKVSLSYAESRSRGDILSCIINDVETLGSSFINGICSLVTSLITAVGISVMMISISWEITFTVFLVIPLIIIIMIFLVKKSQHYFLGYQQNLGKINGCIEETLSGYETVKVLNAEKDILNNFDSINNDLCNTSYKAQFSSGFTSPIMALLSNIVYVISCIFGGYLAVVRGMLIGDITAFITYSGEFIKPLMSSAGSLSGFQSTFAASKRIFELLDSSDEQPYYRSKLELPLLTMDNYNMEFKNVSFGYDSNELTIKNISFKIKQGQSVAIVGETGSGKTTLTKLIMRFYNVNSGEIILGGKDITDFEIDHYRSLFGIVTQSSWLYSSTILENIRYGNIKASDEQIKFTAQKIGLNHFIESLPNGYDTVLEEGITNLSEGQKQLLCIARALISDCKILILDEATASVDTFTESCLQKCLKEILKDKTSIIIAHRLSTIQKADVIFVMQDGELIECGTHKNLLLKKGVYYEMYFKAYN